MVSNELEDCLSFIGGNVSGSIAFPARFALGIVVPIAASSTTFITHFLKRIFVE